MFMIEKVTPPSNYYGFKDNTSSSSSKRRTKRGDLRGRSIEYFEEEMNNPQDFDEDEESEEFVIDLLDLLQDHKDVLKNNQKSNLQKALHTFRIRLEEKNLFDTKMEKLFGILEKMLSSKPK